MRIMENVGELYLGGLPVRHFLLYFQRYFSGTLGAASSQNQYT